jgi:hypothetical protein
MNWNELLIGAVLGAAMGAILNEIVPKYVGELRTRRRTLVAARRGKLFASGAVHEWLLAYYKKKNTIDGLFNCRFGHYETKIPFLTTSQWTAIDTTTDPNEIVRWSTSDPATFPVNILKVG